MSKSKPGKGNRKWPAARAPQNSYSTECESSYFAGRGERAAGHFLFPLPDFDFGTSVNTFIYSLNVGDFQCLYSVQSALMHIHFAIHVF